MISHWVRYDTNEPFVPNLDKFGFVYLITNTKTTKAYVGCKQYFSVGKKKKKHKWEIYTGSSKYLNADIEKIGKEHFTFEVIAEYKNKRSLRYYEAYYQMKWDVLTSTIEGSDEPAFYNSYVGGKWYRPIESYKDPDYLKKIQRPLRCTKENGDIIIFNGSLEMENAGYDASTIFKIAKGGYHKRNDRPKGYSIRKRHKDIIKVEYI